MIVQWCIKGLQLDDDAAAKAVIDSGNGLLCNWFRQQGHRPFAEFPGKLTPRNLDMHVNHFLATDPTTGVGFNVNSPFISLSCGTVERDAAAQTNLVHSARSTALHFGTEFGKRSTAYLFLCWVVVGLRPAVEIQGIAEEVRDLNSYRRYSAFQTQGEVTAKVVVPDNQIRWYEKWEWRRTSGHPGAFEKMDTYHNPRFIHPESLSNVRELI